MSKKGSKSFLLCLVLAFEIGVGSALGQADGGSQIPDVQRKDTKSANAQLSTVGWYAAAVGEKVKMTRQSAADSAWNCLVEIRKNISDNITRRNEDTITEAESEEKRQNLIRDYLDSGVSFWKNHPGDSRKYKWINSIVLPDLKFWDDNEKGAVASLKSEYYSSPVDRQLLSFWKENMAVFQPEIKSSSTMALSRNQKIAYFTNDLEQELINSKNREYRGNIRDFLDRVGVKLDNCFSVAKEEGESKSFLFKLNMLFLGTNNYGLTFGDLSHFLERYEKHENAEMRTWVKQKIRVLDLESEQLQFSGKSMEGQDINLAKLRGKVVLLDFWNVYCSTCVARMPAIKVVYDKYKKSGFEVLSMYAGRSADREKIEAIKKRLGAEWPIVILGDKEEGKDLSVWKEMATRYGFHFVPQLLLLDKNGKMKVLNGTLIEGDIEAEVVRLLKK